MKRETEEERKEDRNSDKQSKLNSSMKPFVLITLFRYYAYTASLVSPVSLATSIFSYYFEAILIT